MTITDVAAVLIFVAVVIAFFGYWCAITEKKMRQLEERIKALEEERETRRNPAEFDGI